MLARLNKLSIRFRLFGLGLLLALIILGVAYYLNQVSKLQVDTLADLTRDQERLTEIQDLQAGIGRFIDLLEFRRIARNGSQEISSQSFDVRIDAERKSLSRAVRSMASRLKNEDLFLVDIYLTEIEDAYEKDRQQDQRELPGSPHTGAETSIAAEAIERIELALLALSNIESGGADEVTPFLRKLSKDYEIAIAIATSILVISMVTILLVILNTISRPLNSVFRAISEIDQPDSIKLLSTSGPSEFEEITKALKKHLRSVDARLEAEFQAHESEARFRDFAAASGDFFWETGRDFQIFWYHGVDGQLPKSLANRERQKLWNLADGEAEADSRRRMLHRTMERGEKFRNFEIRLTEEKLSRSEWWQFSGAPYHDESGNLLGYRGVALNISDKKEVEAHLRRSHSRELIAQMTSGVAHDFNNLLAVLQSNLELLTIRSNSTPESAAMIGRCARAAKRGTKLTGQLLSLSRRQELHPEPIKTEEFISDFVGFIRRTLPDNIQFNVSVDESTSQIFADPHYLQDALLNLSINARDAMPEGGTLSIDVRNSPNGSRSGHHERMVELCLWDTGQGIPEHIRERIFDPFFTTKSAKGSGLGLSMVRGFVEQSGGALDLQSRPGEGTKVCLTFPSAPAQVAPQAERLSADPQASFQKNVLLVEDDADVRESLIAVLTELGHDCLAVENAEAALETMAEEGKVYDLLISDIMMPTKVQGDELARIVSDRFPSVPIILISGYPRRSDGKARDIPKGVPVLRKPIDIHVLAHTINGTALQQLTEERGTS